MKRRSHAGARLQGLLLIGVLIPLGGLTAALTTTAAVPYAGPPPSAFTMTARSAVFDVRSLPAAAADPGRPRERPEREGPPAADTANGPLAPVGSGVGAAGSAPAPSPSSSFEGLAYNDDCGGVRCGQGHPPDTNGDVGATYYIETVNTSIAIYSKITGSRVAGFSFDALMSQGSFGNLCDTDNFGDPVVLYDTFASRWIITDFAFQLDSSGNVVNPPGSYQCFAVSKSSDPVNGGWNFYSIHITDALQDYPKFGIWPDGLYMSANMFGFSASGSFQNVRVWALNRAQMEAGTGAQVVQFNAAAKTGQCSNFTLLPSNARVQTGAPPAGRENLFAAVPWPSAPSCTKANVLVWKFHVDWSNTASSTFAGPSTSATATGWAIPPGTVPEKDGNALDTLEIRAMMQNQYSNIAGVESLWDSHTVAGSSASQAAVRWYQVPVTGGTVGSAIQAATYNPDSKNRWLPSVGVDRAGDMAIGYSVADGTIHPAIRYAGRLAGDAVNTITQTETSLIAGAGAQVGTCGGSACTRWGDYSAMTLDPDGCTFWYTNEYYADLSLNDHTRIGSFAFPSCASSPPPSQPPPTPTPSPSPTPSPTPSPSPSPTASPGSTDKTPPAVTSFGPTTVSPTNAATIGYALIFNESVTGLTAGDFSHAGTATGCTVGAPSGSGASYTVSVSSCSGGTLALTLNANTVSDTSANLGPTASSTAATVTIDRTAPTVTAPRTSLRSGTDLSGGSLRVSVTWTGSDTGGAGIASYDVAQSKSGGAFAVIRTGLTGTSLGLIESPSYTYRYEVRAHDRAGNIGGWLAGPTHHPALVQQSSTSIVYHGTWTTVSSTAYSGGSAKYAGAAGAYASYTFSGRSIGAVLSRGPNRGAVKVYVDGALVTTIDLYSATNTYRYVAFARTWSSVGTHTIKVVVVGTAGRPRVFLDAFEVLR